MVGIFSVPMTNAVVAFNFARLTNSRFRILARMLTEYSNVRYALVTNIVYIHNMLRDCYCMVTNMSSNHMSSFTFQIENRRIRVTEQDVNRILQFSQYNLVPEPTNQELFAFFQRITYDSELGEFTPEELGNMYKQILPKE